MRVTVASIIIYDLIERWMDLEAHYSDLGILPREALWKHFSGWNLSFHSMSGYWQVQAVLFSLALIFAIMLLVGYRTRFATIASWIFIISLQNRNPVICYGGDSVIRMLLFWGMFLPWGARFAVDTVKYEVDRAIKSVSHMGSVGYVLQICFIYWFTAILKDGDPWRVDFSAVYYAVSLDELKTGLTDILFNAPPGVNRFLTAGTLIWEGFGPFFLLIPHWRARLFGVVGFVLMHTGFGLFMRLGIFPFVSIVCVLGFIPANFWNLLKSRFDRPIRRNTVIYYDGTCGFCSQVVQLLKTFLILPFSQVLTAQDDEEVFRVMDRENTWVIRDHNGALLTQFDGIIHLLRISPWLFWLSWILKPFRSVGNRMYKLIAQNRESVKTFSRPRRKRLALMQDHGPIITSFCMFSVLFVLLINLVVVYENKLHIPERLSSFARTTKITQNWGMFAPYPYRSDGWYLMPSELEDGTRIDVFTNEKFTRVKPESVSGMFKTTRWSKYYRSLRKGKYRKLIPYFIRYYVKDWNRHHPTDKHIRFMKMMFIHEKTLPDYQVPELEEVILWQYKSP
jgi:predicted DCC family thiol-disulfide oxidoreductase YuxK